MEPANRAHRKRHGLGFVPPVGFGLALNTLKSLPLSKTVTRRQGRSATVCSQCAYLPYYEASAKRSTNCVMRPAQGITDPAQDPRTCKGPHAHKSASVGYRGWATPRRRTTFTPERSQYCTRLKTSIAADTPYPSRVPICRSSPPSNADLHLLIR